MEKEYIGDGVYVHVEWGQIILTTSDGNNETNRIVLEPQVYSELVVYVKEAGKRGDL